MKYKLFLIGLISLFIFSECKKGPDDPFISLRSRKARVTGDWKMTSGKATYSGSSTGGTSTYNGSSALTYDGSNYVSETKYTAGSINYTDSDNGTYMLKVSFKKDGTFEWEEIQDGDVSSSKGTWNFTGKIGDAKNKEQIVLFMTSESTPGNSNTTSTGNQPSMTFKIKELRNKKMVLTYEQGANNTHTEAGATETIASLSSAEYVFEQ